MLCRSKPTAVEAHTKLETLKRIQTVLINQDKFYAELNDIHREPTNQDAAATNGGHGVKEEQEVKSVITVGGSGSLSASPREVIKDVTPSLQAAYSRPCLSS